MVVDSGNHLYFCKGTNITIQPKELHVRYTNII